MNPNRLDTYTNPLKAEAYADEIADRIMPPGAQGPDDQPIPPAVQAQLAQQGALIKALTQSVQSLTLASIEVQ